MVHERASGRRRWATTKSERKRSKAEPTRAACEGQALGVPHIPALRAYCGAAEQVQYQISSHDCVRETMMRPSPRGGRRASTFGEPYAASSRVSCSLSEHPLATRECPMTQREARAGRGNGLSPSPRRFLISDHSQLARNGFARLQHGFSARLSYRRIDSSFPYGTCTLPAHAEALFPRQTWPSPALDHLALTRYSSLVEYDTRPTDLVGCGRHAALPQRPADDPLCQ